MDESGMTIYTCGELWLYGGKYDYLKLLYELQFFNRCWLYGWISTTKDDGSGLCDCWATGIRAAHLLSIYSTAGEIFEHLGSLCKVSKRGAKKPKNTVGFFLEKLAKKHRQISVLKNNSVSSSHAKFTMQGASKEILNPEEQTLISFVLAKACDSAPLVIIGSSLDSPDQQTGEQSMRDKIEITGDQGNFSTLTECRRKILARHVSAVNYLQEAGNIFEELASEI